MACYTFTFGISIPSPCPTKGATQIPLGRDKHVTPVYIVTCYILLSPVGGSPTVGQTTFLAPGWVSQCHLLTSTFLCPAPPFFSCYLGHLGHSGGFNLLQHVVGIAFLICFFTHLHADCLILHSWLLCRLTFFLWREPFGPFIHQGWELIHPGVVTVIHIMEGGGFIVLAPVFPVHD